MNCDWNDITIGDIGYIVTGKTPSTKVKSNFGGDIHFITPKDLQVNKHVFVTERTLTKEGLKSVKGSITPPDSICVSCIGNLGYVAKATMDCTTNQQINSIIPYSKYDHDFVFYLMKSLYPIFKSYEKQSTTLSILNKSSFAKIKVKVPDFKKQRKIAGVLSALDDKIELNNKINRNLEAQAQAIFKSWFIDFEPFKNGKFIDSELGKIPEGWSIGTIGDISIISTGKRPDKRSIYKSNETPIPIIGASSIMGYTNKVLYDEKILVTGRVGTHGIIQKIDSPCWPSDNTLVLRSKNLNFLHNCLLLINWKSMNRGSTQPLITQNDLKNTRIILPQDRIIQDYEQLVYYFDIKFYNNNKEIYVLSQLRDILLPKLLSGEIDVTKITV